MKFKPPQKYSEDEIPDVFEGPPFTIDISKVKESFTDFINMSEFLKTTTLTCATCSEFPCHRNQDPEQCIGFCYEVREDIPTITPEMIAETNAEIAKRRGDRTASPLKQIKNARCSICGLDKVSFADDLTFETTRDGKPTVIHGLSGLRCSNCGDIAFDSDASKMIDELTGKDNEQTPRHATGCINASEVLI